MTATATKKRTTTATVRTQVTAILESMPAGSEAKIRKLTQEEVTHKAIADKLHAPALAVAKVQHGLGLRDWSGNAAIAKWAEGKPKK
jgi:hypothetical protein